MESKLRDAGEFAEHAFTFQDRPAADQRPDVIRVPTWTRWPWLRAGFSTRMGGRSTAYTADGSHGGELNLGWTKDDLPEAVQENRRRFLHEVQGDAGLPLLTVLQIHSGTIHAVNGLPEATRQQWITAEGKPVLRGDGLTTSSPGLMLGIITADCVPVLLADTRTHAVAALHAGWRGTLACIVEHSVEAMQRQFGTRPEDLVAAIGPCIRQCCFAVGDEVQTGFEDQFIYAAELFQKGSDADPRAVLSGTSQRFMDLVAANRRQLLDGGVPESGISVVGECTACTRLPDGQRRYFSHRAERGFTGRMLNVIGAVE